MTLYQQLADRYGPSPTMERACSELISAPAGGELHRSYVWKIAEACFDSWAFYDRSLAYGLVDRARDWGWGLERDNDQLHHEAHLVAGDAGLRQAISLLAHSVEHGPIPYLPQAIGEIIWSCQLADFDPAVQAADNPAHAAREKAERMLAEVLWSK